jgi:hypothetical protein
MVEITADGWESVPGNYKHVAFLRNDQTQPLPIPIRGGSILALREVTNIRKEQFVLAAQKALIPSPM